MKRNTLHKILTPILLVLIVNQMATGVFGRELSREAFEFLHKGGGIALACLAAVHLILNFSWIKASYFSK